ncbi:hypothetical protein WMY93_019261 [Mugilogobius chulae]|uniref:C-type lectin domain-containing protein n=1 Tax=Mugilogobius chulae TaxID=88201 RepID=A0AAW0NEU4_9GOBI
MNFVSCANSHIFKYMLQCLIDGSVADDESRMLRPEALYSATSPYVLYQGPMTWFEAQTYCREYHSDLATIVSAQDIDLLYSAAAGTGFAWIGLFDDMTKWKWLIGNMDHNSSHFSNWASSNPNYYSSSTETRICVLMLTSGLWDDTDCAYVNTKVCYDDIGGYTFVNGPLTWAESQSYCVANKEALASVRNMDENTVIGDMINKDAWIGLYRHTWTNWSDSTFSTFSNWDSRLNVYLNTSATFHCAMVDRQTGTWLRASCNSQLPFICNGQALSSGAGAAGGGGGSGSKPGTETTSDTLKSRYTSRIKLRLNADEDLNNDVVQSQILQQIQAKLEENGLSEFRLRWTQMEKQSVVKEQRKKRNADGPN